MKNQYSTATAPANPAVTELPTRQVPVRRIRASNAGPLTGSGTNSYLLGHRKLALVDPGPADAGHLATLREAIGDRVLDWILVTHTHADHSPGAVPLAQAFGARLIGLPAPHGHRNDTGFRPDGPVGHGDVLEGDGFSLECVHTPGHVSNHLCYLLREEGMLFTGDHILEGTSSVILPPDGHMGHYMASLDDLLRYPLRSLAPGHGNLIQEPHVAIERLLQHRQAREQAVADGLRHLAPASVDQLLAVVYAGLAEPLLPWARLTLQAHLQKLAEDGKAVESADGWCGVGV